MFCANCGNKIPDEAKFCAKCGQPVDPKENSAESGSQPQQKEPAGTTETKPTAGPAAGSSDSRNDASGSERLYNPDAGKQNGNGERNEKSVNASAPRKAASGSEESGLYNPDAWKKYDSAGGQKRKGGKDLSKRAQATLLAGRILVPAAFVLLMISCFVTTLNVGGAVSGDTLPKAPDMMYTWIFSVWRANIEPGTFNIIFWIVIGLIAALVLIPVFFVRRDRRGSGWIVGGCIFLWILFLLWIFCIVQLNGRGLFSYTAGLGYYLLGAAVVLDTVGTVLYTHRSY